MFLVPLVVFWGVKFGFRKSCLCKGNDKYEVCHRDDVTPDGQYLQYDHDNRYNLQKSGRRCCVEMQN